MKERNYEALVAGMHKKETFEGAEEVIKKDFKLKLPDRRYIHMWNSPEISQFRGVQARGHPGCGGAGEGGHPTSGA